MSQSFLLYTIPTRDRGAHEAKERLARVVLDRGITRPYETTVELPSASASIEEVD